MLLLWYIIYRKKYTKIILSRHLSAQSTPWVSWIIYLKMLCRKLIFDITILYFSRRNVKWKGIPASHYPLLFTSQPITTLIGWEDARCALNRIQPICSIIYCRSDCLFRLYPLCVLALFRIKYVFNLIF